MNEETLEDTIIRLNKESSNYENLLHLEQKKLKVFFDMIKTIPIKHYQQEQYIDLLESIKSNIFKEENDG